MKIDYIEEQDPFFVRSGFGGKVVDLYFFPHPLCSEDQLMIEAQLEAGCELLCRECGGHHQYVSHKLDFDPCGWQETIDGLCLELEDRDQLFLHTDNEEAMAECIYGLQRMSHAVH